MRAARAFLLTALVVVLSAPAGAEYVNFEASHVHPIAVSGSTLVAVNTPSARLEVFSIATGGALARVATIPVGLEPVSAVFRTPTEVWVVNHLSDTVSVVDLTLGSVVKTLHVGDEPTDIAFAGGRAFVAVSQEDRVRVYDTGDLDAAPAVVDLFSRDVRALAVSNDGTTVYAVTLRSGNQTSVVNALVIHDGTNSGHDAGRLAALNLNDIECDGAPPAYPPLPPGITRAPGLDPTAPGGVVPVALIVRWNESTGEWEDENGTSWTHCLPIRLPDHDLFLIDAGTLAVSHVDHVGTSLFEVSVQPGTGKIYVPHTEARNEVRFEHALGVQGHMVDNRMAIVDPAAGHSVTQVDLNAHVNRGVAPGPLSEREASISQPGHMAWAADGSAAYLTAIGSRKLFRMDGTTTDPAEIFGPAAAPDRGSPDAVVVGEGPTGVALHAASSRAYVLLRFSNSIALVDTSGTSMAKVGEVPLHDPTGAETLAGRRFLYDGIDSSAHGDAACSTCHLSGDMDGLAWDLGNPEGEDQPYATAMDNVRFILPIGDVPTECDPVTFPIPGICSSQDSFDPQKGPMTTQTLRGMLEPLHWRGDRPTMNNFNGAFVGLMGKEDVGPPGDPKGLGDADMEAFRQFALRIAYPPNPNRTVTDTVPAGPFTPPGHPFSGDPAMGEFLFDNHGSDAGQPCSACHTHPFGAAGGALGGVTPSEPTSASASALFNGALDGSPHSDLEVPHLRNMYEKTGPLFGTPGSPRDNKTGFGFIHDGSIPDMGTFLSAGVFTLNATQTADIAAFMFFWPTETRPAVGQNLTLPPGAPTAGHDDDETLLATLEVLGDMADPNRHCELTSTGLAGGRVRAARLEGGVWIPDVAGAETLTTNQLREAADGPLSFLCATPGSGLRLGGDLDEDGHLNGDDCAESDAGAFQAPAEVANLSVDASGLMTWDEQASATGSGLAYDLAGGSLSDLGLGLGPATACVAGGLAAPEHLDTRPAPPLGDGFYYLPRAVNSCETATFGPGRAALDTLTCT